MKMSTRNDVLFIAGKEGFRFTQEKKHVCLCKILLNYSVTTQLLPVNQREFVSQSVFSAMHTATLVAS